MTRIKQYDKVLLKTGYTAYIVEILDPDKEFIVDIDIDDDTETEEISIEEIERVIR